MTARDFTPGARLFWLLRYGVLASLAASTTGCENIFGVDFNDATKHANTTTFEGGPFNTPADSGGPPTANTDGSATDAAFDAALDAASDHETGVVSTGSAAGSFEIVSQADSDSFLATWGDSQARGYAVSWNGAIWSRSGTLWTSEQPFGDSMLTGVSGTSTGRIFIAQHPNGLIYRSDGSWNHTVINTFSTLRLNTVWASDDMLFFGADQGKAVWGPIPTSFDGWQPNVEHVIADYPNIVGHVGGNSNRSVLYASGFGTAFFDGSKWTRLSSLSNESIKVVWGPRSSTVDFYLGGDKATLVHVRGDDQPSDAQTVYSEPTGRALRGIWGPSRDFVIAVGERGKIVLYDATRHQATAIPSPTDADLTGVWGSSLDDVWIVGQRKILRGKIHF